MSMAGAAPTVKLSGHHRSTSAGYSPPGIATFPVTSISNFGGLKFGQRMICGQSTARLQMIRRLPADDPPFTHRRSAAYPLTTLRSSSSAEEDSKLEAFNDDLPMSCTSADDRRVASGYAAACQRIGGGSSAGKRRIIGGQAADHPQIIQPD
ncbi:hypothetical protein B0H19DRAFT_1082837 [Mycena capillaripes]|nr:hypothetical protein B0H19DRAFT_1082837 [Mycena capillaripes]